MARIKPEQLDKFADATGATDEQRERLHALRRRADERGRWEPYTQYLPEVVELIVELGEEARTIQTYDTLYIQGLAQSEGYARTVIESARAFVRPTEVDYRVELRMRRQRRLHGDGLEAVTIVLSEAAIRHQIGGPEVMHQQLRYLCELADVPKVSLHVLPFTAAPWPSLTTMLIFGFPDEDDGEVVSVDDDLTGRIYEDRDTVKIATYLHHSALSSALSVRESLDRIRTVMKELCGRPMDRPRNPYPALADERFDRVVGGSYVKASASSGTCVTLTAVDGLIGVQDDKLPPAERRGRTLVFDRAEFAAFLAGAKAGEFDHLLA